MVTKYELVVVLEVNRPEDEITQSLDRIQEVITKNDGTIDTRESWGKRRLAYPINRRRDGHYTMIQFDADSKSQLLPELNRYLRITEDVLRFLITRAVIGKSRGNPPSEDQDFGYRSYGRGGRDRGDYRGGGQRRYEERQRPAQEPAPAPESNAGQEAQAPRESTEAPAQG